MIDIIHTLTPSKMHLTKIWHADGTILPSANGKYFTLGSHALISRFIFLETKQSFLEKEDIDLEKKLLVEIPHIFRWALEGRKRLFARKRFIQPKASAQIAHDMRRANNPIAAFIEDRCELLSYPHTKENDLSVATFIEWNDFSILFTGDLEQAGWESLIARAEFRQKLSNVTVLMASHHGRANGCCNSIFNWNRQRLCNPQCTIISDGGIEHATQDTRNWYKNRTRGCVTTDNKQRWVLSTCNDGNIKISVGSDSRWHIETNYQPYVGLANFFALSALVLPR